jgi:hypothetical protein
MPPFHEFKVLDELAGKFWGKHGIALQGFFQGGFEFLAGFALPGVNEYGAGDFTPCYGVSFPHGGQGYGIGGMLRFPAMRANIPNVSLGWGNFNVFYGMHGVHRRLLTLKYTPLEGEKQLFPVLWGLPGAASLGYLPDLVNYRIVINGVLGFRPNSGLQKPLFCCRRAYFENSGDFFDSQSFHTLNFAYFSKKINTFKQEVIDKTYCF